MLMFYVILVLAITHNVSTFMIGQKRFKSLHITLFYVLASCIVVVRCIWFIMVLVVVSEISTESDRMKKAVGLTDALGTYFELLLGIQ